MVLTKRVTLSALIMLMVSACVQSAPSTSIPVPGSAAWWTEEHQRQEIVAQYCNAQHSNPECAKAQAAWRKWQASRLLSDMQAEHQKGFAYYAVTYGLGPFVGAPTPDDRADHYLRWHDANWRSQSYLGHDDYVSPLVP